MIVLNYLLGYENLKIYQDTDMFHFSLDSVLLPNFVTINQKTKKILDIGTGNAVIPMILSTRTKANITGVEIQEKSFQLGEQSIIYNHLEKQISLIHSDIKDYANTCESDTYDVITCNPPFFKVEEQSHLNDKDEKTIARHEVALTLEDIMKVSKKILKNNGLLAIVHRPERLLDILTFMREYNIEPKKIQFVYPKQKKEANIVLVEGSKNGKKGLKILPPIYAHEDNGNYTKEVQSYFVRGENCVTEEL